MTNKDFIYDKLNEDYRYLEDIMGNIYDGKLQYEEILPALGELAQRMLNTQKHLAGDDQLMISQIENKEVALSQALSTTTKHNAR